MNIYYKNQKILFFMVMSFFSLNCTSQVYFSSQEDLSSENPTLTKAKKTKTPPLVASSKRPAEKPPIPLRQLVPITTRRIIPAKAIPYLAPTLVSLPSSMADIKKDPVYSFPKLKTLVAEITKEDTLPQTTLEPFLVVQAVQDEMVREIKPPPITVAGIMPWIPAINNSIQKNHTLYPSIAPKILSPKIKPRNGCLIPRWIDGEVICVQEHTQYFLFEPAQNKFVTFILVFDVSRSMQDDLIRLSEWFSHVMSYSYIQDTRWRMLFTTADHGDHTYKRNIKTGEIIVSHQKWQDYQGEEPVFGQFMSLEHPQAGLSTRQLDKSIPHYSEVFRNTIKEIRENSCPSSSCKRGVEQPLRALNSSVERIYSEEPHFFHPQEHVIAFLITDEDERTNDPMHATTAQEVVENFNQLFPHQTLHAFTMVIQDEECLAQQQATSSVATYGKKVQELSTLTHGMSLSLCQEDYHTVFEKVSYFLKDIVTEFTLTHEPIIPEEVEVDFLNTETKEWELQGRQIIFSPALKLGEKLKVSYLIKE